MTNAPRHNHTDDTFELLSAYLDDALDVVERRRADTLLRTCSACAGELDELRMLHQTLRALPVPMPKRSFTLDPSQVRPRMRLFPVLRFASLVSAMVLVVILGIDTLGGARSQSETAATFQAPAAASAPEMQRQSTTEAPLAEQDAPLAAGAAPEPTTAAALSAPAAAPPAAETTGAAADAVPGTAVVPEESGVAGGSAPVPPLTNSDPSSLDTATLEQPQARVGSEEQPNNPWRLAEIILAIVVILLAGATWWTARQRL